jgi:hypothetical protein
VLSSAAALLDSLFERPAWCAPVVRDLQINEILACPPSFSAVYEIMVGLLSVTWRMPCGYGAGDAVERVAFVDR